LQDGCNIGHSFFVVDLTGWEKMDGWEQNDIFCATSNQEFAEDIHDH
jgi:hypothetical protein